MNQTFQFEIVQQLSFYERLASLANQLQSAECRVSTCQQTNQCALSDGVMKIN